VNEMGLNEASNLWNTFDNVSPMVQRDFMVEKFGEIAFELSRDWDNVDGEIAELKEADKVYKDKIQVGLSYDGMNTLLKIYRSDLNRLQKEIKEFTNRETEKHGMYNIDDFLFWWLEDKMYFEVIDTTADIIVRF
jgi:hypothetical protein